MKKILSFLFLILAVLPVSAQTMFTHPWQGRKVAYFGDSITDPRNSGSKKKYWGFLHDWLGITPYVYAVSGRQWNDIPRQADKCFTEHADSIDAILIFMGTNDYNSGVKIGEWYDVRKEPVVASHYNDVPYGKYERNRRTMSMDKDTYRGRINIAMSKLKKMYPDKQIVLLTPIHRALFQASNKNIQPTEEYANCSGIFLDEYINSVKEAGNIWAVPVIDLNAVSGLYPLFDEGAKYFHKSDTDRLHPNDAGHERIARTLMYQLVALPVF